MRTVLEALVVAAAFAAPALWLGRPSRRPAPGPRWTIEGLDRRTREWTVIDTATTPEDVQAVMVDALDARRHVLIRVIDSRKEVAA